MDVATGAAVAADNNDAVGAVVPPSSTKDNDAYVGALVVAHLQKVPVNLLQPPCCCHRAAAVTLCATDTLRAAATIADAATAAVSPPSCH